MGFSQRGLWWDGSPAYGRAVWRVSASWASGGRPHPGWEDGARNHDRVDAVGGPPAAAADDVKPAAAECHALTTAGGASAADRDSSDASTADAAASDGSALEPDVFVFSVGGMRDYLVDELLAQAAEQIAPCADCDPPVA